MPPREALVADDDSDSRAALAELLRARGYTVREAENGKVALHMIAERLPNVLLVDLEMPVMSGWDVIAFLARVGATERSLPWSSRRGHHRRRGCSSSGSPVASTISSRPSSALLRARVATAPQNTFDRIEQALNGFGHDGDARRRVRVRGDDDRRT
jgi:CheY-like chemotaxis protein